MNSQTISTTLKPNQIALITALIVGYSTALFLSYIDEGNYNFNNLSNPSEWIFVSMYALIFTGFIYLAYSFLKKTDMPFVAQLFFSVIAGLATLPFLVVLISGILRIFGAF